HAPLAGGGQRRQGLLARLVHLERPVEPGDLQQAPHLGVGAADAEARAAVSVPEQAPRLDQDAEAGRVDEVALGQVDEDAVGAASDRLEQRSAQLLRGRVIEFAGDGEGVHPVLHRRLDLEWLADQLGRCYRRRSQRRAVAAPALAGASNVRRAPAGARGAPRRRGAAMEPITGRRPFLTAARAALRGRDGAGLAAGGATLAFVVAADLLLPGQASLTGMYVLAPFVAACFAALEATLVLAILALAVGGASGSWNADFGQAEYLIRLAGLAAGGIFATLAAFVLRRLRLGSGRLRVLNEAAAVADGSLDLTSTLARVTELIVPAAADVCMVDVIRDGR